MKFIQEEDLMFAALTEKARRVFFFARYEASQWGAVPVEPEHVLLGLLRADGELFCLLAPSRPEIVEDIISSIKKLAPRNGGESPTSVMPLSGSTLEMIQLAAEETGRQGHRHVGTEHLLLALLLGSNFLIKTLLERHGLSVGGVRDQVCRGSITPQSGQGSERGVLRPSLK